MIYWTFSFYINNTIVFQLLNDSVGKKATVLLLNNA